MSRTTQIIERKMSTQRIITTISLLTFKNHYLFCQIILLYLSLRHDVCHGQQLATTSSNVTTTTLPPSLLAANDSAGSELILSVEEFVDSREVPLILIDGTTDEDSPNSITTEAPEAATTTTTAAATTTTSTSENSHNGTDLLSSSIPSLSDRPAATLGNLSEQNITTTTLSSIAPTSEPNNHEELADDDELDDDTENGGRLLPNDPGKGSFELPQNISQYMDYIEKLFHDLRHQITHLFEPHLPQLIRTSQMVELTSSCSYDMLRMALALRQFEPWALRMIDSSGKVPEGIFEGSFTALGSYDECLNTVFQSSSLSSPPPSLHADKESFSTFSSEPSSTSSIPTDETTGGKQQTGAPEPTQGKYCLVTVSPFMPPKPPADKVDRLFQEEANRRNYTRDDQFSRLSPMFYYMKFRIGVCIPSTCDQSDMNSISNALSSSLRLNITIPDCRVKQTNQQLARHQLVGGLTFALVSVLVLLATLIDCFKLKWKQLKNQDIKFVQETNSQTRHHHQLAAAALGDKAVGQPAQRAPAMALDNGHKAVNIKIVDSLPQLAFGPVEGGRSQTGGRNGCVNGHEHDHHHHHPVSVLAEKDARVPLMERLRRHWTWMSFSMIANFSLYFQTKTSPYPRRESYPVHVGKSSIATPHGYQRIVACLNGIRVLSLCWVIVANSYLTLDPRATKRLTKTREAPRDFLFQLVVQASLAIETFFFLSGLLMSLSFSRRLRPSSSSSSDVGQCLPDQPSAAEANGGRRTRQLHYLLGWIQFYVHRYVRMTPPAMLVIAFSMYAYHYGDGPLWFEATQRVHQSCTQNWWRHLLHVANFIDTRQMCFIHYWYIAADMQLFLFAPVIMFFLFKYRRVGYVLIATISGISMGFVFYTTYTKNLPPTLLFYSTDPESRREFGNTVMTKPMTHAMPYLVGMLVGWWCFVSSSDVDDKLRSNLDDRLGSPLVATKQTDARLGKAHNGVRNQVVSDKINNTLNQHIEALSYSRDAKSKRPNASLDSRGLFSATGIFGSLAVAVALVELFLPYKWNNSQLPSRLMGAIYAALFRLGWSLVLAYVVISCRHRRGRSCEWAAADRLAETFVINCDDCKATDLSRCDHCLNGAQNKYLTTPTAIVGGYTSTGYCYCGSGGNYLNRALSLNVFAHLSKLAFVAYLIHLPLMSVFIGQTRGLFAFSHMLVIHFAVSYLVISFTLAFLLVHFIEFPFITFERLLFDRLFRYIDMSAKLRRQRQPMPNTLEAVKAHEKHLFYQDPRIRPIIGVGEQRRGLHEQADWRPNLATNHLYRTKTGGNQSGHHDQMTTEKL